MTLTELLILYWREKKQTEIKKIIENCSGLFMEATANTQYAVQGDSLKVTLNSK